MRIAIPDNNGEVNQHYGQSKVFAIIDIQSDQNVTLADSISTQNLQHNHGGLAELLKRHGVEVAIVGGIGQGAVDSLEAAGLSVQFGASGSILSVAQAFARGEFISKRVMCNHNGAHHHYS